MGSSGINARVHGRYCEGLHRQLALRADAFQLFKRNNVFPELSIKCSGFPQDFLRSKKASSCNNLAASIERQHFLKIKSELSVSVLDPASGSNPPFMVSLMLFWKRLQWSHK